MKRFLLFLTICATCTFAHAALTRYYICDWTGDVQYKKEKDTQWQPADKKTMLTIVDSVKLAKNSQVRITDEERNNKIPSLSVGVMSIGQLLDEAQKANSKSIFSVIIKELKEKKMLASKQSNMTSTGVGKRAMFSDIDEVKRLANAMAWISRLSAEKQLYQPTTDILLHRNNVQDGVTFALENKTDQAYCVNVLHINMLTKIVSLCYVISEKESDTWNIMLPPTCCYCGNTSTSTRDA